MNDDVLALAGPVLSERQGLFDFIVKELCFRETQCQNRIRPVRIALENQRDNLLAFAAVLDKKLTDIAQRFNIPIYLVHNICKLQVKNLATTSYWHNWAQLHRQLPDKFHLVQEAVIDAMNKTPRASSIVENLNSRLRNYFFLRRQIGPEYLDLLRFFLNHRRFMRSECAPKSWQKSDRIDDGGKTSSLA